MKHGSAHCFVSLLQVHPIAATYRTTKPPCPTSSTRLLIVLPNCFVCCRENWQLTFQLSSSLSSMCSPARASSCCTLSTLPVPAYAQDSSVTWAYLDILSFTVLATCTCQSHPLPQLYYFYNAASLPFMAVKCLSCGSCLRSCLSACRKSICVVHMSGLAIE